MDPSVYAFCRELATEDTKKMERQMVDELGWSEPHHSRLSAWKF